MTQVRGNPHMYPLFAHLCSHPPRHLVAFFRGTPLVSLPPTPPSVGVDRAAFLLVGAAGVGKSSLARSLQADRPRLTEAKDATHGVIVRPWVAQPITINGEEGEEGGLTWHSAEAGARALAGEVAGSDGDIWRPRATRVALVDCGGNPGYAPLALSSLAPRMVVLIVWDASDQNWDDVDPKGD
jgi:GTPase SAR1 family protein